MEIEDDIYLAAKLMIHEYLITSWFESMLAPADVSPETLQLVGTRLREGIAFRTSVGANISRDAPTLQIQSEALRQFDELWLKVSDTVMATRSSRAMDPKMPT